MSHPNQPSQKGKEGYNMLSLTYLVESFFHIKELMLAVFYEFLFNQSLLSMGLLSDLAPVTCHVLLLGFSYTSLRTLQLFHLPMKKRDILNSVLHTQLNFKATSPTPRYYRAKVQMVYTL
jgi:hypothetical protein